MKNEKLAEQAFTFRPYCEATDFSCFLTYQRSVEKRTTSCLMSGGSPYMPESELRQQLAMKCEHGSDPVVVADGADAAIGCVFRDRYCHQLKHQVFHISMWEHPEWMESVLRRTLDEIFQIPGLHMAVCVVPGYEKYLLDACGKVMHQVGEIPNFLIYEGSLYSELTFILERNNE